MSHSDAEKAAAETTPLYHRLLGRGVPIVQGFRYDPRSGFFVEMFGGILNHRFCRFERALQLIQFLGQSQ